MSRDMSRDMSTAGRVYQGLRGDDGERYVPLIQLPGNATTRHAQAALAYLRLHALELDALATVADMRAWWWAQRFPAAWELSFKRWRGDETP